jgi:hypothetical protein
MSIRSSRGWLLLLASTVIAFGAVELVARLLLPSPRYHDRLLEFDSELGFRGIPTTAYAWRSPLSGEPGHDVVLNSDGFRGRALQTGAWLSDTRRIAFVGDSFLVGLAVPEQELLPVLVERALSERGESVEVYNTSVIDFGTGQELLLLDRVGDMLQPDLVVLLLHPPNDVANNSLGLAGRTRVSPGDAIRPYVRFRSSGEREIVWADPLRSWARSHSRVFGYVERGLFPPVFDRVSDQNFAGRLQRGLPPREFLEVFARHDPGHRWEVAWRETESLLRAFRDRCMELEAELLVVVVPSVHQVVLTPKRIRFESEARVAGQSLGQLVDWNGPEKRLERFFNQEGIEAILLLEAFRERSAAGERLYSRDHHLARAGNARAAEAVVMALTEGREAPAKPTAFRHSKPVGWAAEEDPSWLNFLEHSHAKHVGDGFVEWLSVGDERPGGWLLVGEGLVALRSAEGALVVRGVLAAPGELEIGVVGVGGERVSVSEAGPFEAKLVLEWGRVGALRRHVAVGIRIVGDPVAALIQDVGFESARPSS